MNNYSLCPRLYVMKMYRIFLWHSREIHIPWPLFTNWLIYTHRCLLCEFCYSLQYNVTINLPLFVPQAIINTRATTPGLSTFVDRRNLLHSLTPLITLNFLRGVSNIFDDALFQRSRQHRGIISCEDSEEILRIFNESSWKSIEYLHSI